MSSVRKQAASWFTRLMNVPKDHPDHEQLRLWLSANPLHAREYQAFCELWGDFSSTTNTQALAQAMERRHGRRTFMRRGVLGLAALLVVGLAWRFRQPLAFDAQYATAIGERRRVSLPDGSELYLAADTRLHVSFERGQRQVYLLQGQAIFDVAHETNRAFRIDGGLAQVTVLGTRFVVERDARELRVSVERGWVRVDNDNGSLVLAAGEVASSDGRAAPQRRDVAASNAFAFEQGRLVLEQAGLEEIANSLSRYRRQPVRVLPGKGKPSMNAVVQLDNVEGFVQALPSIAPIEVSSSGGVTYLRGL
ncbi:FecR domain-containing protein [Pseudomonas kermanshahensis]|uniref:FecR family protein n=1 Tax=Pseudomonas kermanshahensis TaxID=2745482 RepID=UPI0023DC3D86|nr:FecR domain-containing protein [Pseudomonas kermanshahensis]WEL58071.1 FecR domain-containing protein [Pseudomonas kermanshahensis]